MKSLKSYRELNPGKGYWDWKVLAFEDGGPEEDPLVLKTDAITFQITPNVSKKKEGRRQGDFIYYEPEIDVEALREGKLEYTTPGKVTSMQPLEIVSPEFDLLMGGGMLKQAARDWYLHLPRTYGGNTVYRLGGLDMLDDAISRNMVLPISHERASALRAADKAKAAANGSRLLGLLRKTFEDNVMFNRGKPFYGNPGLFLNTKNKAVFIGNMSDDAYDFVWKQNFHKGHKTIFEPYTNGLLGAPLDAFDVYKRAPFNLGWKKIKRRIPAKTDGGEIPVYEDGNEESTDSSLVRDILGFVPYVGDGLDAYDIAKNAYNGEYMSALGGAALLAVPNALEKPVKAASKAIKRTIPSLKGYKESVDAQLNAAANVARTEREVAANLNNETYKMIEDLMDDPRYLDRARLVKSEFGDDIPTDYATLIQLYNESPELLPKAMGTADLRNAVAKMQAREAAAKRHMAGGEYPGEGEWDMLFDAKKSKGREREIARHEGGAHYTDFRRNKSASLEGDSNMYYQMSKDLTKVSDDMDNYLSPGEIRAYMNSAREKAVQNRLINNIDDHITEGTALAIMNSLPVNSVERRALMRFKNNKARAKWFNSLPLLGTSALAVNATMSKEDKA